MRTSLPRARCSPTAAAERDATSGPFVEGDWKLIVGPAGTELYDLAGDGREQDDVAARHPEVVERLLATLDAFRAEGFYEGGSSRSIELDPRDGRPPPRDRLRGVSGAKRYSLGSSTSLPGDTRSMRSDANRSRSTSTRLGAIAR